MRRRFGCLDGLAAVGFMLWPFLVTGGLLYPPHPSWWVVYPLLVVTWVGFFRVLFTLLGEGKHEL
jgi:hypothetical protein